MKIEPTPPRPFPVVTRTPALGVWPHAALIRRIAKRIPEIEGKIDSIGKELVRANIRLAVMTLQTAEEYGRGWVYRTHAQECRDRLIDEIHELERCLGAALDPGAETR